MLLTYGATVETMHTAICFLNKGALVILVYPSLITTGRKHRIRHNDLQRLRTISRQLFRLDGLIRLHLCTGKLCTQVWFGIAPHPALHISLSTKYIDRFIHVIFTAEKNIIPRNSQLVAIVAGKPQKTEGNLVDSGTTEIDEAEKSLTT